MKALGWWLGLWNRVEHPRSMALVRVLLGTVLLLDLSWLLHLGLVESLYGPAAEGGLGDPLGRANITWIYTLFPATLTTARVAFGAWFASVLMFTLGFATRWTGLAAVLLSASLAHVLPPADRGIDMLLRNAIFVLSFSRAGDTWSIDARLRTGSWSGTGASVPSWPRYLLCLQLFVVYFTAGVQKVASTWTPFGDWAALYLAMGDPAFAMTDAPWVASLFPLTQAGTAVSWVWEWCAPLMLLAWFYRDTRTRSGRLRSLFNRSNFLFWYLLVGAIFHVGTAFTLQLGIFPLAMLALYPATCHPDVLSRTLPRSAALRSLASAPPAP